MKKFKEFHKLRIGVWPWASHQKIEVCIEDLMDSVAAYVEAAMKEKGVEIDDD